MPSLSLWLEPESAAAATVATHIASVAHELRTQVFSPHVTVIGGFDADIDNAVRWTSDLASSHAAMNVTFDSVDFEDVLVRAAYLKAVPAAALTALREEAGELFGFPPGDYMPHMSLAYSNTATTEARRQALDALALNLPLKVRFTSLALWHTELGHDNPDFSTWTKVMSAPLTALPIRACIVVGMPEPVSLAEYVTNGGVSITRTATEVDLGAVEPLIDLLDTHRGAVFTSTYEYPGRYTRWDMGFVDPPLVITAHGRTLHIEALNDRGLVLLAALSDHLVDQKDGSQAIESLVTLNNVTTIQVWQWSNAFTEEQRSRQPSVFSVLRDIISFFGSDEDSHLGLYGAFGYDLAFQFEPVTLQLDRPDNQRDLVLYLPDSLTTVDHMRDVAIRYDYEFTWQDRSTAGIVATTDTTPVPNVASLEAGSDHAPGEYAATVRTAMDYFKRGDLFEVVPGQTFAEPCEATPSQIFRRLRTRNPAPYGAIMNLGEGEYLVGASPEMYVRVEGQRVETCPISGTIARGDDVLGDADRILELLNSEKDENELTMCTDVDRNDKSRVCDPSTIRVIGRRQIEVYSRLIHTVDHVEGMLLPQYDGLDAFLAHTWAVTVTGAPKLWAMRFIEEHEKSPRAWYGGAIGTLMFNGNVNTGLTLRTIWIKDGIARVRAGATLLIDSDPEAEERETRTKASALLDAIRRADVQAVPVESAASPLVGEGLQVLLVDHEDSFVHTLAGYLRRTGAHVTTVRVPVGGKLDRASLDAASPDFVVLSPGPGRPEDFHIGDTIGLAVEAGLPVFGVCLGLQGIVEHFGGALATLDHPAHGRASEVNVLGGRLFAGLPAHFTAGRYHSLFADSARLTETLVPTAELGDGLIMAVEHQDLPIAAVQFHPESMMTMKGDTGMQLIESFIRQFVRPTPA